MMASLEKLVVWTFLLSLSRLNVQANVIECKYREKDAVFNPFSSSIRNVKRLEYFFPLNRFPCGFKMADYRCGDVQAAVIGENSLDKDGLTYLSDLTVVITTVKKNKTTSQTLKLSTKKFKRYISKGNFTKSPWSWTYSGTRPKRRHRITGSYNQSSRTAVVSTEGVTVTFNTARVLTALCNHSDFTVNGDFDDGVLCGRAGIDWRDVNRMYDTINNQLPACHHHRRDYHNDYIMLAKQRDYHTKPLCKEAAGILLSDDCEDKADKVYECYRLYEKPRLYGSLAYGGCIRNNTMDPFKVYVACLRALCKTEGCSSTDTCNTLRNVATSCPDVKTLHVHMNITTLLSLTDCPPLPPTTTTTTTTTSTTSTVKTTTVTTPSTTMPFSFASDSGSSLALGKACNDSSECGVNAQCSGNPAQCTCIPGYYSHKGRCGKRSYQYCVKDTDCLPLSYCRNVSRYSYCSCTRGGLTDNQKFCYKRIGSSCEIDMDCGQNAVCNEGVCACDARSEPDHDKTRLATSNPAKQSFLNYCYLKLNESCNETSECGVNAECTGVPKKCTCLTGYVTEKGRCGKPVGAVCETRKHRQCVVRAYCYDGTCQCVGWANAGQFCGWRALCKYTSESYNAHLNSFSSFSISSFDTFPCRYKLANIQCGRVQAVVTFDNDVDTYTKFQFGRMKIGNVTVNITTVNSLGQATSQISRLDVERLLKLEASSTYNRPVWDWTYIGPKPRQRDRIEGTHDRPTMTAMITTGQLTVNLTKKRELSIACTDRKYSALEEWPKTFCGGPNNDQGMYWIYDKAFGMIRDVHHHDQRNLGHDIMALIKQNIQQTKPLCREASSIATSSCKDIGEKLYRIRSSFWVLHSCMRTSKLSEFEFYVASLRVLCGWPAKSGELDACHVFREVAGHCRVDTGHLNMVQLLSVAGCNTTFSTTTTTTRAPRSGGWKK